MLNELLVLERGVQAAGIEMTLGHPDIKDAGGTPTLLVRLDEKGGVNLVRPIPSDVKPWTLRDGQHNSFPFVRLKSPLWVAMEGDSRWKQALDKKSKQRRAALLSLAAEAYLNADAFKDWPDSGLLKRLPERRCKLESLTGTESEVVLATIDRFLRACKDGKGGGGEKLLNALTKQLANGLRESAQSDWVEVAVVLLLGKFDKKTNKRQCGGGLLFEATDAQVSILDPKTRAGVSQALRYADGTTKDDGNRAICALTGKNGPLLCGNFPQPNLPILGQTFLFAKNRDIPANGRYGRFASNAIPVGQDIAIRVASALKALTTDEREGCTWARIPGEAPKQSDLLLAFVEQAPHAKAAAALGYDDAEDDLSGEKRESTTGDNADSIAEFEKRAERLIDAVKAKVKVDFRQTPVRLAVLRKVDPGNRKVVYAGAPTVGDLYDAAMVWVGGERNVPEWLTLPVLRKGEKKWRPMSPPHLAPLSLIGFSKRIFLQSGKQPKGKMKERVGLPAAEVFGLFLDRLVTRRDPAWRRAERILRSVLARRSSLITARAHVQHTPDCWDRRKKTMKEFDYREALRSVTMLGVLLHKLGRTKEEYMNDAAFKLGQLLAGVDVVHAGYCADVRDGKVPPALLGNQVFAMAQTAPTKALAMLARRWKPYGGWAHKAARDRDRADQLTSSKKKSEQARGWDIRKAVRHAREIGPLADDLRQALTDCKVDDTFRAEILLGYIAGLPKAIRDDATDGNAATEVAKTED